MIVVISGASGLVGRGVCAKLRERGDTVLRLVRHSAVAPDEIAWDPTAGRLDAADLEGADAVVHLAGENVSSGRWNAARKRRIHDSRVAGTELLVSRLLETSRRPVFVGASAVGFYGDRGDTICTEETSPGEGFLSEVCVAWEAAAAPLADEGCRVAHLRLGMVLSRSGGALRKMLLPFRLGLGARLGNGRQWISWASHRDTVAAFVHAIDRDDVTGATNLTAPHPVTNQEFTRVLARVLRRPAFLPAPAFALKLALGEMATQLLLSSTRVASDRLRATGFAFEHQELEAALRAE